MLRATLPLLALITPIAFAQVPSTATAVPAANAKPATFDVVSIKPASPGESYHFGFGPSGYSAGGVPLSTIIYQAYFAFNDADKNAVTGIPDWAEKNHWDIEAKVAPEDIEQYQRENRTVGVVNPIGRQMLQNMLADRFKLVVHRVPAEMTAYAITVAKDGPKLTQAQPGEAQPSGSIPLPGGGYLVPYRRGEFPHSTYYAVSMPTFARMLRGISGGPVIDRTGLTGKYDFHLDWLRLGPDEREGFIEFDDPDKLSHWNFKALGLKAEHIKIPTEHIVIDSISHPTEN